MVRAVQLLAALVLASPCGAAGIAGQANVIDGDTIEIHGQRIRLFGIDAPESGQTCADDNGPVWRCGQKAALALQDFIGRKTVSCEDRGRDRYDRIIAVCHAGSVDVSAWLAKKGWAVAYRRYSDDYVNEEIMARIDEIGIWRGTFVWPWDWRKGVR